jgi:hypothetical protein
MEPTISSSDDPKTSLTQPVESPTDSPELQTIIENPDEQVQIKFSTVPLDDEKENTQSNEHIPKQAPKQWGMTYIILSR